MSLRILRWVVPVLLVLALAPPAHATPPGWALGGTLGTGRDWHTATVLQDGSVLVAGGFSAAATVTATAERYFPATNTWRPAGTLVYPRSTHVAALLPNGKVLVAGGSNGIGTPLKTAELYDPASNAWTAVGELKVARRDATATPLPNGKVLVAGGWTAVAPANAITQTVELFNPTTNAFDDGNPMGTTRALHAATRYANGDVLVTGGYVTAGGTIGQTTELYDAAKGTWSGKGTMGVRRAIHEATLLADGRVLVSAGGDGNVHLGNAEVYTPGTNAWSPTLPMLRAHNYHTASLLTNGKVLVTGGVNAVGVTDPASELFDPATNTWSTAGSMVARRYAHTSTLLSNGRVLIASGNGGGPYDKSAELWTPTTTLLADPAVSFDDLTPGTAGGAVAHIRNTGDSPMLASGFGLAGSFPGDYAVTSDTCSGAAVAPGATCDVGLRFGPGAAGARSATLTFDANTAAINHAVSLIGRGIAPAPQPGPGPGPTVQPVALQPIVVTLAYTYSASAKNTKLAGLVVKGVPKGSTVTVACKKGCARKSMVKRNVSGNVRLTGLVTKRLKVGTVIVVTVSRPGAISAIKTLKIRKRKAPQVTTKCQAPGQAKPAAC